MDTVFNQTFQDFEVIILDDASTDDSREIIERYRLHPKVKAIVYNEVNCGVPFKQWEKGLSMVDTEWVWIAESDDECEAKFLESLLPAINNINCVIGISEISFVDENSNIIKTFPSIGDGTQQGASFLRRYMLSNCYICNSGMAIFRKSVVEINQVLTGSFKYCPDYYFWCMILTKGLVYTNGLPLSYFRKHQNEFTKGKVDSILDHKEHANILKVLLLKQYVFSKSIQPVIIDKLVTLHTRKKGLTPLSYKEYIEIWYSLAKICDVSISSVEIYSKSLNRKIKHLITRFF